MTKPKFDQDFWEQLWSKTLLEHADKIARRPPNAHLTVEAANLDSAVWQLIVAEERPRAVAGTGVDAVIRAQRRG